MVNPKLHLAITGDERFAKRHRPFIDALAERCASVELVTSASRTPFQKAQIILAESACIVGLILQRLPSLPYRLDEFRRLRREFILSETSYRLKSLQTERNLRKLKASPQVVMQIFGLYRPFWTPSSIPFVHYLDYTTALSRRNWPPNIPPLHEYAYTRWFDMERTTYHRAAHLFPMSSVVARSLVEDYGISMKKITIVGSGGRFTLPLDRKKEFGSRRILFNANPYNLKGGDIVLSAFEAIRKRMPDAVLVVVGKQLDRAHDGVENPGFVADPNVMRELFLKCDLVVAPSRADAFPGFLIEAMFHGVPCVASAVGGIPEIIDDGVNGTIIPSPGALELADAAVALLSDFAKLEAYSEAALMKAKEHFTWARIAGRIVERLEMIV